jgi:cobalt/nickel transport protein
VRSFRLECIRVTCSGLGAMPTLAVGMFPRDNTAWPRKRGHGTRCFRLFPVILIFVATLSGCSDVPPDAHGWKGVDETVIEKVATEAGHPPQPPLINTEQGDLLLFLFLTAGAIGGFIAGYAFRTLFPPKSLPSPFGRGAGGEGSSTSQSQDVSSSPKALTLTLSQRERGHAEGGEPVS